jgi:hypothetical protein
VCVWGGGSSHCCGGYNVDDGRTPRVIAAAEAGSMMLEPFKPLL